MPLLEDSTAPSSGALSSVDDVNRLRLVLLRTARNIRTHSIGDVTQSQVAVLATLSRYGESTVGQIADYEHVQPPSASRIVAHLERQGLVVRRVDRGDRRRAVIALSDAGEAYLSGVRRAGTSWLGTRLADLNADELDRLNAALPVLERLLESES